MTWTKLREEIKKMRFEEAYGGWLKKELTQKQTACLLGIGSNGLHSTTKNDPISRWDTSPLMRSIKVQQQHEHNSKNELKIPYQLSKKWVPLHLASLKQKLGNYIVLHDKRVARKMTIVNTKMTYTIQ